MASCCATAATASCCTSFRQAGIAVLNEIYAPGWEAEVNGRPAAIFRANHLLRAVRVEQG